MKNSILLIAICVFISAGAINSQPEILWSQTYGGESSDGCSSVIQTADDGFALAGVTSSFGAGAGDFFLVRTDEEGEELWTHTYGGESLDQCMSIIQTADGGFALAGQTFSYGAGQSDVWLVVTDNEGEELWSQTYGGERTDYGLSILQTDDGGFVLAGFTNFGAGGGDFWLIRTNEVGDSLWSQTYGGEGMELCQSVIHTLDGGFALAGWTGSFGEGRSDFWLVVTDEEGEELWSQTYGDRGDNKANTVIQTGYGGFALAGTSQAHDEDSADFWFVITDEDGEELWSENYGGERGDFGRSAIETVDGGFALAGYSRSLGQGFWQNFWFVRTNEKGEELWTQTFGDNDNDICHSIIQASDGGFVLAGGTNWGMGEPDIWLVKTELLFWMALPDTGFAEDDTLRLNSEFLYEHIDSPSIPDSALVILVEDGEHVDANIYDEELAITAEGDWFGQDSLMLIVSEVQNEDNSDTTYLHLTVTESQTVGQTPLSDIPREFKLFEPYPNPFNATTTIRYGLPFSTNVSLELIDLSGSKVLNLVSGNYQPGIHTVNINSNNLPSGLYFVRMEASEQVITRKIMLIR